MSEQKIIFQLAEGKRINQLEVLFTDLSFPPERLFDIRIKLELLQTALDINLAELDFLQADKIFTQRVFPFLSDIEREMYRTYIIAVHRSEAQNMLDQLLASGFVDYGQFSASYTLKYDPVAAASTRNPGLSKIECDKAWSKSEGADILIAVIDSGINYNHSLLAGRIWQPTQNTYGRNFVRGLPEDDPFDSFGHGTHCAGIVSANNDVARDLVISVAPKAKIMALKAFTSTEVGGTEATSDTQACVNAIQYAVLHKAKVMSNSWTATDPFSHDCALRKVIDNAYSQGCIIIFAAGNQNRDIVTAFPANYAKVVSVAATTSEDGLLRDSNFGPLITTAAPGEDIVSLRADSDDGVIADSGTSMACPHVAGVIALLLKLDKDLTFCQVREIVREKGNLMTVGRNLVGNGRRINANNCVNRVGEFGIDSQSIRKFGDCQIDR